MRLTTPYAPPTFLKPCIVVDTAYNSVTKETAVLFNEALNADHALAFAGRQLEKVEKLTGRMWCSGWVIIKKHKTLDAAISYHLELTKNMMNGGSQEEWEEGYPDYLELYAKYCPDEIKDSRLDNV